MIRTWQSFQSDMRHPSLFCVHASFGTSVTTFSAHRYSCKLRPRSSKPGVTVKSSKNLEHQRRRGIDSGKSGPAFSIRVTHPYTDNVIRSNSNRPAIAKAKTGTCFPCDFACTFEISPTSLLTGTVQLFQRIEGEIRRGGTDRGS